MTVRFSRQELAAAALVESGFTRWTRRRAGGDAAVLTYHGLRRDGVEAGVLDESLHEREGVFREVCAHLAKHYEVLTLEQVVTGSGRRAGRRPGVALTFDDGYRSNFRLALPVLREFGLPATVFASTAFVGGELLWFQKLDLALERAEGERLTLTIGGANFDWELRTREQRRVALGELLGVMKRLTWAELRRQVEKVVALTGVDVTGPWPEAMQPLSEEELRELAEEGLVEIGGHTHRHPVLGRCTDEEAREEIAGGAERLRRMLGRPVRWFAYPNGGGGDFDPRKSAGWLEEAGYEAAFSMINGRARPGTGRWAVPRYGAPRTRREAEATVSGAFEKVRELRETFRRRAAL